VGFAIAPHERVCEVAHEDEGAVRENGGARDPERQTVAVAQFGDELTGEGEIGGTSLGPRVPVRVARSMRSACSIRAHASQREAVPP